MLRGGIDGGCIQSSTNGESGVPVDFTSSNRFETKEDQDYLLEFSVIANRDDQIRVVFRRDIPDYAPIGLNKTLPVSSARKDYSFAFKATEDQPIAKLFFSGYTGDTTYWFDNISLKEVEVTYNDPSDDAEIIVNKEDRVQTFSVNGSDLDGNVVTSVTLQPYTSQIILNCFNNNDGVCNNLETADSASGDCAGSIIPGDVNEDGDVNISDIQACIKDIIGTENWPAADVDGDGDVDIKDIQEIIRIIVRI